MEDNEISLMFRLVFLSFCVLVVTIGGCAVNKQRVLAEMVEKGVDPLRAHCAVYLGDADNNALCTLLAAQKE